MRIKIFIIVSILISFGMAAHAQNLEWISYSHNNGISGMAQEGDYLWVASGLGLYKINRLTLEKELFNSARGASSHGLTAIAIDDDGNKWVGSDDGLAKFDNRDWIYYHVGNSPLPHNHISSLLIDRQSRLWIGTAAGLAILDNNIWQLPIDSNSAIAKARFSAIAEGPLGEIWLGVNRGYEEDWHFIPKLVELYRDKLKIHPFPANGLQSFFITDLCVSSDGKVWIASGTYGNDDGSLASFQRGDWSVYRSNDSGLDSPFVWAVAKDTDGHIWASGTKIFELDGSTWLVYDSQNSPLSGYTYRIFVDSDGIKWFGDSVKGLVRFDGQSWLVIPLCTSPSDMASLPLKAPVMDKNNVFWWSENQYIDQYSYKHGLGSFDGQQWIHHDMNAAYYSNGKPPLALDENNFLWMAISSDSGCRLVRFDRSNWLASQAFACDDIYHLSVRDAHQVLLFSEKSFMEYDFNSNKIEQIVEYPIKLSHLTASDQKIFADDKKSIWIGTDNGLLRYYKGGWIVYDTTNSKLPDNRLSCLALKDSSGIWIATFGGDLSFYDGSHWITYPEFKALSTTGYCLLVDRSYNLWIGTSDCGLIKFDGSKFTTYNTINSGLSGNQILYLATDGFGNLWITQGNRSVDIFREGGIIGNFISYSEESYFVAASHIPMTEQLFQTYPNPFKRVMTLRIDLPEPQFVRAIIYDILGREVQALINDPKTAGTHYAIFNGQGLATGIYFIRVKIGRKSAIQKILLIK